MFQGSEQRPFPEAQQGENLPDVPRGPSKASTALPSAASAAPASPPQQPPSSTYLQSAWPKNLLVIKDSLPGERGPQNGPPEWIAKSHPQDLRITPMGF